MSDDSTRSAEPFRFVDPHVHWWDRSNEWLVTATQEQADAFNMGDVSGMNRNYLRADYAADASEAGVEVPKIVWVTATFAPGGATPEVEWVDKLTSGVPEIAAIIGSVEPGLSREDREQALAAQSKAAAFRGVRVLAGFDYESEDADEYMRMLADGGFVYDLVSHYETMAAAAKLAERHPDVPFILEHCGWPFDMQDPSYINAWKKGIDALASVESISCKISGLAMTCHAFNVDTQRPFVEHCIESFGIDRCMFASNFPVDALYGSLGELIEMFRAISEPLGDEAVAKLFHANAELIYGI